MNRTIDLMIACLILILTAPFLLIIAIVLKIESDGPIFYRRRCVGTNGRPFDMLRFRTMVDTPVHRTPDERLTPVGRFLQNYSLDEFALLLNVVKGDMSIVGPRPTETTVVDLDDADWQRIISVRPGVISYSTLNLATAFNTSDQQTRKQLELRYLNRRSLPFDLHVFRRAVQALFASKGNVKARGKPSVEAQNIMGHEKDEHSSFA